MERSLTEVREAHQKALAMVATLEEEIEWLSHPSPGACWRLEPIPKAGTTADVDPGDRRGGAARCGWRTAMPPTSNTTLPGGVQNLKETPEDLNLEDLLELGLEVACFLWGPVKSSEEENVKTPSQEPPIEGLEKWVTWRAWTYETPSWWQELVMVPGVEDHKKLAREVWASF